MLCKSLSICVCCQFLFEGGGSGWEVWGCYWLHSLSEIHTKVRTFIFYSTAQFRKGNGVGEMFRVYLYYFIKGGTTTTKVVGVQSFMLLGCIMGIIITTRLYTLPSAHSKLGIMNQRISFSCICSSLLMLIYKYTFIHC